VLIGVTQATVGASGIIDWSYSDQTPQVGANIYEIIPQEDGCIAPCKVPATSRVVYFASQDITSPIIIGQTGTWTVSNGKPNSNVYVRIENYINGAWVYDTDLELALDSTGKYTFTAAVPAGFFTGTRRFRQINPEETFFCEILQRISLQAPGSTPPPAPSGCITIQQFSPENPNLVCGATNLTINSTQAIGQFLSASGITVNTAPAGVTFTWDGAGSIIPSGTGSGPYSISVNTTVAGCTPCTIAGTINLASLGRWRITGDVAQPTSVIQVFNAPVGATVQVIDVSSGAIAQASIVSADGTALALYLPSGFVAASSTTFIGFGITYRVTVNGTTITS
jgi:hypothetical protein